MNRNSTESIKVSVAGRAPIVAIRTVPAQKNMRPLASKADVPRALPSKRV